MRVWRSVQVSDCTISDALDLAKSIAGYREVALF